MKLMSFNTQHCLNYREQKLDLPLMAATIRSLGADVVGLNEMRQAGPYGPQTEELSALTGLGYHYFAPAIEDGEGPYGNGLLSRYPILSAETVPVPDPSPRRHSRGYYESRCLLKARLDGGYTVLVIHFGLMDDEQESAVATILANLEPEKCILMGDFNVTPDNPILAPIRERMRDTAECFTAPCLSFPSDKPEMKIDYIFVTPDLIVESADIPALVASDHRPHVATVHDA